jgi:FkbH-like protein
LIKPSSEFLSRYLEAKAKGIDTARCFLRDHWPHLNDLSLFTRLSADWDFLDSSRPVRIAFAGSGHRAEIAQAVRWYLDLMGIPTETYLCPVGVLLPELLNPGGELRRFSPDFLWIFSHARDLDPMAGRGLFPEGEPEASMEERIRSAWSLARSELGCEVIQNTFEPLPLMSLDQPSIIRELNSRLRSTAPDGVRFFDLAKVAEGWGHLRWTEDRLWLSMGVAVHPSALPHLAMAAAGFVAALLNKQKKCIILDLDNTLWGGEAGDLDPNELAVGQGSSIGVAFALFQRRLLELKRNGLLLAICSKNRPERVREVFRLRPDMPLHYEDFSSVEASFDSDKAKMIEKIIERLGLRTDAFMFIDDNPAEREWVRHQLPDLSVPDWPLNPEDYRAWLDQFNLESNRPSTAEDSIRAQHYMWEEARDKVKATYASIDDYLVSLDMRASLFEIGEAEVSRASQLLGRTNQFNLSGEVWTESRLRSWMARPESLCLGASLEDRFGPYGMVSVMLGRLEGGIVLVDQWVVSCRVFARRFEEAMFGEFSLRNGSARKLRLGFRSSGKNHLVATFLEGLGFSLPSPTSCFELELPLRREVTYPIHWSHK